MDGKILAEIRDLGVLSWKCKIIPIPGIDHQLFVNNM